MSRCADCKMPDGEPRECLAVLAPGRYGHFCAWAKGSDGQLHKVILGRSRLGLDPERVPVAESLSLLADMKACPHRTPETECGCGGLARCALGKGGGGLVNHSDCFECLSITSR